MLRPGQFIGAVQPFLNSAFRSVGFSPGPLLGAVRQTLNQTTRALGVPSWQSSGFRPGGLVAGAVPNNARPVVTFISGTPRITTPRLSTAPTGAVRPSGDRTALIWRGYSPPDPTKKPTTTTSTGKGVPGADFGSPTAEILDQELAGTAMAGQGATIIQAAADARVPVTMLMAIFRQESSYQYQSGQFNFGGLTGGTNGRFADFSDMASGIRAVAENLGSERYRGLTVSQVINMWAPPFENDTQAYINNALETIRRLGGNATADSIVTYKASATTAAMLTIWNSGPWSLTQEFGNTEYSQTHSDTYAYGNEYGVTGHTGLDIGLARGTRLYAPGSGVVQIAGGSGYFRDEDYGDNGSTAGRGELRLLMDDGTVIILGHTSSIALAANTRIKAGDFLGLSGSANGDHLHLEVRVPDSSMPSGYRIVDPRIYFGG